MREAGGTSLRAALNFTTRPLIFENYTTNSLTVSDDEELPAGTLLRLTLKALSVLLRFVANITRRERERIAGFARVAVFDQRRARRDRDRVGRGRRRGIVD